MIFTWLSTFHKQLDRLCPSQIFLTIYAFKKFEEIVYVRIKIWYTSHIFIYYKNIYS